jgi:hypothetical protein
MFAIVLGVIGFLTTSGALGAQIIGAASLMEYWFWFTSILVSLIAVLMMVVLSVGGAAVAIDSGLGKLGTTVGIVGGGFFGTLIATILVVTQYALLWLSNYIQENTDPLATTWQGLGDNVGVAIIATAVIIVVNMIRSWVNKK